MTGRGKQNPKGLPEQRAALRAIYEATPGMTLAQLAIDNGIAVGTMQRWSSEDGGWIQPARKATKIPHLSARATELADSFKVKMSELGKPMSDAVAAAEAQKELTEGVAVNVRAAVLDRHRQEWSAPRKIAYEAMRDGNFDKAKLAKISAECLTLIQNGESRAFGLDTNARTADNPGTILIDREGSVEMEP